MSFAAASKRQPQTLVVHVEDRPGVLNRVTSLFRRRAFNICSLTVGRTDQPGLSRMTIVVDGDQTDAARLTENLYKLISVVRVQNVSSAAHVQRDLALIKVRCSRSRRGEILHVCEVFRARVVDVSRESLVVEITGTEDKIDGLLEVLEPFGIIEMCRTGRVAMARGPEEAINLPTPDETGVLFSGSEVAPVRAFL